MAGPPPLELFVPGSFPPGATAGVVAREPPLPDGRPLSFSPGGGTTERQARESRIALAHHLGARPERLHFLRQVHGALVVRVTRASVPSQADGMITNEPGEFLCLCIADCCALLVYDASRGAVGAFHAGWRGARDGIACAGLSEMGRAYGTLPRDVAVFLSPCASADRYEVGAEVARLFPLSVRRVEGERGAALYLDLRGELVRQLTAAGVPSGSIESSRICSIADARCHSHRREGDRAGRMAAFIGMPAALPGP